MTSPPSDDRSGGGPGRPPNWPAGWLHRPDAAPATGGDGMVATTDRYASEVGADVLRAGGNAVDAAVAASFALAVVNPEAGNLGGGGFLVVRTAGGVEAALDYRSRAPAAATRDMFLDEDGELTERSEVGAPAAAIPGSVKGLAEAHARFGSLPWERLVEPAVDLARGFEVEERLARSYPPHIVEGLRRFPESAGIFLPEGAPPRPGDTLRQTDLAGTLERIRDRGPAGFYHGETADRLVGAVRAGGGVWTREDLTSYEAVWREPVRFRYRGSTVLSMPPPSSGGIALAATARLLEPFDLGTLEWHGARHVHLLAEAWKRVWVDRNHYVADPDLVEVPAELLASARYAAWRGRDIGETATPASELVPGVEAYRGGPRPGATTHLSVVAGGSAVSLTTTLNTWYGSKLVAEGTGVLLNNEMDDFAAKPGAPNHFGLVQGEANAVAPGKRPLSAMSPTIVLAADGRLSLVLGTPGGATIITTVFQVLSNVLDHGLSLVGAVHAPRVHHQHLPDVVTYEKGGLPEGVLEALREMRHEVSERAEPSGDVQAVRVLEDGSLEGAADPRRGGTALGT